jgi:SAM-dependent methyltransferase
MTEEFTFRKLFDGVAPHYEERIIKAFAPMAASLVEWIGPSGNERVLDIGTGTGIAARLIATEVGSVVGVDISNAMLATAHNLAIQNGHRNANFTQGDAHSLPFSEESFDLVISSFGFNATDPRISLPEVHRVLAHGGRLCFQEWGGVHAFNEIFGDVIGQFAVPDEDSSEELQRLRDFFDAERPWYEDLQLEDDYLMDLDTYGFREIWAKEHQPVKVRLSVADYISYKTAWTPPRIELAAMDESARGDCLDELYNRLYEYADVDGIITFDPMLFRVTAVK